MKSKSSNGLKLGKEEDPNLGGSCFRLVVQKIHKIGYTSLLEKENSEFSKIRIMLKTNGQNNKLIDLYIDIRDITR